MESWFTSLMTHSLTCSLCIVGITCFLESLALIGLIIPGIILMTTLGTLIGNGTLSFYPAWVAGTIGCLIGDWISYCIGLYFKDWLHNLSFLKKNYMILNKIKFMLYKYSMLAVIIGRFIGPTRPFVPMVAGMLKLPLKKFIIPNIIGCILWSPIYFFPGIMTGIAINIPYNTQNNYFKWLLLFIVITMWIGIWLATKWWKIKKNNQNNYLKKRIVGTMSIIILLLGLMACIAIQFHPTMPIFKNIFFKILSI